MIKTGEQEITQSVFQKIDQRILKEFQSIKPEISCSFTLDRVLDVNQLENDHLNQKYDHQFSIQIRGNYVVQVIRNSNSIQKTRLVNLDICGGFQINQKVKFEIKREQSSEQDLLSKPLGITFFFSENDKKLELINQEQEEKIEKFGKILQTKFLVQKNFHKIFKPLRKLGKGASSTVIQGKDLRSNIFYAVKGFKKDSGYSLQNGIFFKQMSILKQIQHTKIIKLHAIFQSENSLYMVLDKYDQNLYDYLMNKGLNSQYQLKAIIKGILQILEYLHSFNIMHRDIKPENIMIKIKQLDKKQVSKNKFMIEPILIDFGFAQNEKNDQYALYRCGTPGFIAPQILTDYLANDQIKDSFNSQASITKHKYTKACDIFSLGCLFHILLTGKMPFEGKTKKQLILNNVEANINSSNVKYKVLDISAKKLLFRMLQKDPIKRITAQQALQDDFFKLQMVNFKPMKVKNPFLEIISLSSMSNSQKEEDPQLLLFQ